MIKVFKGLVSHLKGDCQKQFIELVTENEELLKKNDVLLPFKEIAESRVNAAKEAQWKIETCERANERAQRNADEALSARDRSIAELAVKAALVLDLNKQIDHERSEFSKSDAAQLDQIKAQEKLISKQRDLIFEYEREKEHYELELRAKKRRPGRPRGS